MVRVIIERFIPSDFPSRGHDQLNNLPYANSQHIVGDVLASSSITTCKISPREGGGHPGKQALLQIYENTIEQATILRDLIAQVASQYPDSDYIFRLQADLYGHLELVSHRLEAANREVVELIFDPQHSIITQQLLFFDPSEIA